MARTSRSYTGDKKRTTVSLSEPILQGAKDYAEASSHPGGFSGLVEDALQHYISSNWSSVSMSLNTYAASTTQRVTTSAQSLKGLIESLGKEPDAEDSNEEDPYPEEGQGVYFP